MKSSALLFATSSLTSVLSEKQEITFATDCTHLEDGLHYLKPTEDGEIIPAVCNKGYTIIDPSLHMDSISSYFSSFYQVYSEESSNAGTGSIYGPDCDIPSEESSWRNWWTPSTTYTTFRVSHDCITCHTSESYGSNVAYYMTSYYFCLNKHTTNKCTKYDLKTGENIGATDLIFDTNDDQSSMCNVCDDGRSILGKHTRVSDEWTDCKALRLSADTTTAADHDSCVSPNSLIVKPSVSDNGKTCTCFNQPVTKSSSYTVLIDPDEDLPIVSKEGYQKVLDNDLYIDSLIQYIGQPTEDQFPNTGSSILDSNMDDSLTLDSNDDNDNDDYNNDEVESDNEQLDEPLSFEECMHNKKHLYQKDFKDGTFRITTCGEYILGEDILINFNGPSDNDLNDLDWSANDWTYDELPWFPTDKNEDDLYEGKSNFRGTYQAGFFAGITIESDNVMINLNNKKIEMDYPYYVQQRFFMVISMGNKPFVGDQGPGNFGRQEFTYLNNIVIKRGIIGRTSHQSIHGNGVTNLEIHDVDMENFDVAGLQCNGCNHVMVRQCRVGPQNQDIPVYGRYAHARALLPRLKYLAEEYGNDRVMFNDNEKEIKMLDLVDELTGQMDMIFDYVVRGINYDDSQILAKHSKDFTRWRKAKSLFLNPTGLQDGGSSYGIIFNGLGTGVTQFGKRKLGTSDIELKNVEIHGLKIAPVEKFWASYEQDRQFQGFWFDTLDWESIITLDDQDKLYHYRGDAYHDLIFATQSLAMNNEFCLLNTINLNKLLPWVQHNDISILNSITYMCGSDIQSHDSKGVMGVRVDGVDDFRMKHVHIHDIRNFGSLGRYDNNDYFCNKNYGHIEYFPALRSIEPGYTGTRSHGFLSSYSDIKHIEGLKIDHIKSKYGSALGASLYEGSTLRRAKNIKINDINAGYGLTPEELMSLEIPNYIPRSCSFEIGKSEDSINYPVNIVYDENEIKLGTIHARKIQGYDICKSKELLGNIEKVSSKGLFGKLSRSDDKIASTIGKWFNGKEIIFWVIIGIVSFVGIVVMILCIRRICIVAKQNIENSEYKPLLSKEEKGGNGNQNSNGVVVDGGVVDMNNVERNEINRMKMNAAAWNGSMWNGMAWSAM